MKGRILVVDDNSTNLAVLGELLERHNYEVRAANSGEMAVSIAPSVRPELVLLDVMMPNGIDGYETCRQLRRLSGYQSVPVLFLSADSTPQSKVKGFQVGGTDYVSKPFQSDELLARIGSQLELHRLRHQLEDEVARKTRKVQDLLGELSRTYEKSLALLAKAGEFRDVETGNHTRRIGEYAFRMAELIGCESTFCHHIRHAAPLHDIGKVAIPDRILLKEGPLDEKEWVVMRSHAEKGAEILRAYEEPLFQLAAEIAGTHHERFDGSGYPRGLVGEHIPLGARITTLVDTYDALRSRRPYKPPYSHERAIEVLTAGDGRTHPIHFDPQLLEMLLRHQDLFMEVFDRDQQGTEKNA